MDGLTFALSSGIVFIDIDDIESKPEEIQKELARLRDDINSKKAQWEEEKRSIAGVQKLKEELAFIT